MWWPPTAHSHTTIASRDLTMIRTVPLSCVADTMPGDQYTMSEYYLALGEIQRELEYKWCPF